MNSAARIIHAFQQAIAETGLEQRSASQISNIIGLGLTEAIEALFPGQSRALYADVSRFYRQYFLSSPVATSLFDGAEDTLQQLAEDGYLLAVATGKSRAGLNRELQNTGLERLFHSIRCADETRSKPNPQMLYEIMNELGIEPQQTLMLGDTEYDLNMANNAGTFSIGVSYGVHDTQRLLQCKPLDCLHRIDILPAWLRRI